MPDFLFRIEHDGDEYLILETKEYEPLADVKKVASLQWCAGVNAEGSFGH